MTWETLQRRLGVTGALSSISGICVIRRNRLPNSLDPYEKGVVVGL